MFALLSSLRIVLIASPWVPAVYLSVNLVGIYFHDGNFIDFTKWEAARFTAALVMIWVIGNAVILAVLIALLRGKSWLFVPVALLVFAALVTFFHPSYWMHFFNPYHGEYHWLLGGGIASTSVAALLTNRGRQGEKGSGD